MCSGGWGWGSSFADFDDDSILELLLVDGWDVMPCAVTSPASSWDLGAVRSRKNRLSRGLVDDRQGRGVSCFDSDRDGDLDILISDSRDSPGFYRNGSSDDGSRPLLPATCNEATDVELPATWP